MKKKKAKRVIDKQPKDMVAIADLEIGDVVTFLTIDFAPEAEKIETFDCGIVDISFNVAGKARILTAKGWHCWHNKQYTYERVQRASRAFSTEIPLATKPVSVTVRGISIE